MQGRSLIRRWPYAAVFGLFLSVAGLSYLIDLPGVLEKAPASKAPEIQKNSSSVPVPGGGDSSSTSVDENSRTPAAIDTRLWLQQEARSVDALKIDEEARLLSLNQRLHTMQEDDWRQVVEVFLDPQAEANERVLSAFLIGRGGYDQPVIVDRIFDERLPSEPAAAHSPEEMSQMREKSLRLMILEEMIAAAKADPSRRSQLGQSIRRIDDPYLRQLAMRRLQEEGIE